MTPTSARPSDGDKSTQGNQKQDPSVHIHSLRSRKKEGIVGKERERRRDEDGMKRAESEGERKFFKQALRRQGHMHTVTISQE
jgi:hypothetical protein